MAFLGEEQCGIVLLSVICPLLFISTLMKFLSKVLCSIIYRCFYLVSRQHFGSAWRGSYKPTGLFGYKETPKDPTQSTSLLLVQSQKLTAKTLLAARYVSLSSSTVSCHKILRGLMGSNLCLETGRLHRKAGQDRKAATYAALSPRGATTPESVIQTPTRGVYLICDMS